VQLRDEYDRQQFEPLQQRLLGLLRTLAEARLAGYSFAATGRHARHGRVALFPRAQHRRLRANNGNVADAR